MVESVRRKFLSYVSSSVQNLLSRTTLKVRYMLLALLHIQSRKNRHFYVHAP